MINFPEAYLTQVNVTKQPIKLYPSNIWKSNKLKNVPTGHTPQGTLINPGTGTNGLIARYNFLWTMPTSRFDIAPSDTTIISAFPSNIKVFSIVSISWTVSETWKRKTKQIRKWCLNKKTSSAKEIVETGVGWRDVKLIEEINVQC